MADLSLSLTREKTGRWLLTVVDTVTGQPQDLTGSDLYFHAIFGTVDIEKSSVSGGITITNAAGGLAVLQVDPADTAALAAGGEFGIPCELTLVNGAARFEIASGSLLVSPNVSQP